MQNRRVLLAQAKQFRTCPPDEIKSDPRYKQQMKNHYKICPFCGYPDDEDLHWNRLMEKLKSILGTAEKSLPLNVVEPGQLRYVSPGSGLWRDALFYPPPLALIIKVESEISDEIWVAQTWFDTYMAGPGDLILSAGQTDFMDLFIQCWNIYTLKASNMGECLGKVDAEIVDDVLKMDINPEYLPEWAILPAPFAPDDPRHYFRKLEVEVGYTFSSMAVEALMNEYENTDESAAEVRVSNLAYGSPEDVKMAIIALEPATQWPIDQMTIEQVLVLAEYQRAASDDHDVFHINLFQVHNGVIKNFYPIPVETLVDLKTKDAVEFSGEISGVSGLCSSSSFFCFLLMPDKDAIKPLKIEWQVEEGHGFFHARFKRSNAEKGKLVAALMV